MLTYILAVFMADFLSELGDFSRAEWCAFHGWLPSVRVGKCPDEASCSTCGGSSHFAC